MSEATEVKKVTTKEEAEKLAREMFKIPTSGVVSNLSRITIEDLQNEYKRSSPNKFQDFLKSLPVKPFSLHKIETLQELIDCTTGEDPLEKRVDELYAEYSRTIIKTSHSKAQDALDQVLSGISGEFKMNEFEKIQMVYYNEKDIKEVIRNYLVTQAFSEKKGA